MSKDRLSEICIDPADPRNQTLLSDLQGNILKGHGRNHSVYLHLKFRQPIDGARTWIREFARDHVSSARQQIDDAIAYKEGRASDRMFANLMLSAAGYRALEIGESEVPDDPRFRLGMKHDDVRAWLHDPAYEKWEEGYQEEIHALVILANARDPREDRAVRQSVEAIKKAIEAVAEVVAEEYGRVLRKEVGGKSRSYEHFGFVDGISQPLFLKSDRCTDDGKYDRTRWDPRAPLGLVLAEDAGGQSEESYGSYFVYRKLRQDVKRFHQLIAELAEKLGVDQELAKAQVVGRYPDGRPLIRSETGRGYDGGEAKVTNEFSFFEDPDGQLCPFQAHIRKANPRGEKQYQALSPVHKFVARHKTLLRLFPNLAHRLEEGIERERSRRIARRGVPYGSPDPESGEEQGILFLCAQADIGRQFEFIQNMWSNKNTFPRDGTGQDPLIGQAPQQVDPPGQIWRNDERGQEQGVFDFSACVHLRGGEYFFAPSLSFLRRV